jgi:hypothetical protein
LIAAAREDVRKGEDLAAAVASRSTEQKRYADPKPECGAADGGHRRDGNEDGENGGGQPAGGTPAGSALRSQAPGDPALVARAYHEVDDGRDERQANESGGEIPPPKSTEGDRDSERENAANDSGERPDRTNLSIV